MKRKQLLTIPNLLSFYRLLIFPFILILILKNKEQLFAIFLVINLITDILDGYIARKFKMQTEFGARLDSIADIGTYILAISGVFVFKLNEIEPHLLSLYIFLLLYVLTNLFSLIKFGRFPSLHLYSWKIGGYLQGIFFSILFLFDFYSFIYYPVIIWGILAFSEHLIIQLIITEMKSNSKGLYWVLKNK